MAGVAVTCAVVNLKPYSNTSTEAEVVKNVILETYFILIPVLNISFASVNKKYFLPLAEQNSIKKYKEKLKGINEKEKKIIESIYLSALKKIFGKGSIFPTKQTLTFLLGAMNLAKEDSAEGLLRHISYNHALKYFAAKSLPILIPSPTGVSLNDERKS